MPPIAYVIRKPDILRRLTDRFGIEPGAVASDMLMPGLVLLVSDVNELQLVDKIVIDIFVVNSTGYKEGVQVPAGKRWNLLGVTLFVSTGSHTTSELGFTDGTTRFKLKSYSSLQTVLYEPTCLKVLKEGWKPYCYVDGYTTIGDGTFYLLVRESDSF